MSEDKLLVERRGQVLLMGFNRPKKYNAFDLDMYRLLAAAYGRLDLDPELRCGLVYAQGDHFTAGIELDQWAPVLAKDGFPTLGPDDRDPFGLDADKRLGKPLVFAVHGICFTVGLELMLAGDVRVAADNCRFGQVEVRRGIYAIGGATLRMVQEFGWANAQRYLLTGDEFDAAEAYRIGLVQEVAPAGTQFERGLALAERIASRAPLAVQASLLSSRLSLEQGMKAAAARLVADLRPLMGSEDVQEGMRSFLERREAQFKGK